MYRTSELRDLEKVDWMDKMNNEVIGINITMRPINRDKAWIEFIENLVSINRDKGYAFLYEYYELGGLIHLHESFENLEAYKKTLSFFLCWSGR